MCYSTVIKNKNFGDQHCGVHGKTAFNTSIPVQVPAAPFVIQLPANTPGETTVAGSSAWALACHGEDLGSFWFLILD